jgi:DNA-binding XRE family transcriptional regulator
MAASTAHNILVCAEQRVLPQTSWLIAELGSQAHAASLDRSPQVRKGRQFIVYLGGDEPLPELRSFFRKVGRTDYDWLLLYVAHHSLEAAARIGFLAGQELPKQAEFAFDEKRLREWLKRHNVRIHDLQPTESGFSGTELLRVRKKLDVTQEQLARAIHVNSRTIQNWERNVATSQAERKTRDLRELMALLEDYVLPGKEPVWMRTNLDALGGKSPLDLLVDGKMRDLIVEFRRLQEGQPV